MKEHAAGAMLYNIMHMGYYTYMSMRINIESCSSVCLHAVLSPIVLVQVQSLLYTCSTNLLPIVLVLNNACSEGTGAI